MSEITTAIIDTVKRLEEKHLEEIAKLTKESKSKLEKSVQSKEHRINYLQYWKGKLLTDMSNATTLETNEVLAYIKMKHIYENIKKLNYAKLEISIQNQILDSVLKLTSLSCLAKTTSLENIDQYTMDQKILYLKSADVINIFEFRIEHCDVTDGEFLSRDKLILTDKNNERCVLCNTSGVVLQEIPLPGKPWGMCFQGDNEVLVTILENNEEVILDANSFEIKQSVSVDCSCHGISTYRNTAVIGARKSFVLYDNFLYQNILKTLATEKGTTDDVTLDVYGNVVFSKRFGNNVKKVDKNGKMLFNYRHEKPYGLTVDGLGNVYVNGYESNNIHVVSIYGKIFRILKGVHRPKCIKFLRGTYRFLVGEVAGCEKALKFREVRFYNNVIKSNIIIYIKIYYI